MNRLLVDGFDFERSGTPARFGQSAPEVIQRVAVEVRRVATRLEGRGVNYEVVAHRDIDSIHILPDGDADLNRLARSWREDFEGLGLVICPLLFALHSGAYGAFSPVRGLSPSEDDVSPDMLWLAEHLPQHAILLRPDAAAGVAADAFVIRHELDHARRSLKAMHGSVSMERAAFTLSDHAAQPLFFGGNLETEEIFVHAADVEATRHRLLSAGIRAYPGTSDPAGLPEGLRDARPTAPTLAAQIEMTACIGEAIADRTLELLPHAKAALAAGAQPTCRPYRTVTWGTLTFPGPTPDTSGRVHIPIEVGADAAADLCTEVFRANLNLLDNTTGDHRLLLGWIADMMLRFRRNVIPSSRFGAFLRTLALPRNPLDPSYHRLDADHFKRLFDESI